MPYQNQQKGVPNLSESMKRLAIEAVWGIHELCYELLC